MGRIDAESETLLPITNGGVFSDVAHSLRADGFDASEDGTGRGTPIVPVAFAHQQGGSIDMHMASDVGLTLQRKQTQAVAIQERAISENPGAGPDGVGVRDDGATPAIGITNRVAPMAVRRLTPRECERLQGFPDDHTAITRTRGTRNLPAADGPRYKALGNSMAVNCMAWIGRRIEMADALSLHESAA